MTPWIFDVGAGVYDRLTAQEAWRRHCREMARLVVPDGRAARVLDLGIGPGVSGIELARAAPAAALVGLDLSAAMLARARASVARAGVRIPLVRADAARLPFPDGTFDAATGHSFLYLLPDPTAVLREVRRVLRPGGRVAFLEPSGDTTGLARTAAVARSFRDGVRFGTSMLLWSIVSGLSVRRTRGAIESLLAQAGFHAPRAEPTLRGLGFMVAGTR